MKYLPLVWAGLWRKPMRTVFTLLSIMVAFILFGILSGIDAGFARVAFGSSRPIVAAIGISALRPPVENATQSGHRVFC